MSTLDRKALLKFAVMMIFSLLGLLFVALFYSPFFGRNLVVWHVNVNPNRGFDVYGFVIPLIVVLTCGILYFKRALPKLIYFLGFAITFFIAYFSSAIISNRGLVSNSANITFFASFLIVFVLSPFSIVLQKKPIGQTKANYFASLLLGLSCIPLGLIALDFYALPLFTKGVVGGNGLADGLLLSTLYTPFAITFFYSIFAIVNLAITILKGKRKKGKTEES